MTEINDLIGAEVIDADRGIHVSFGRLVLKLTTGRIVEISALYDEGLFIGEGEES